jgi:hypothetical protein
VPAWLVHQEINRSKEFPFRWVVIRSTSEPVVVNLPEGYVEEIGLGWFAVFFQNETSRGTVLLQ